MDCVARRCKINIKNFLQSLQLPCRTDCPQCGNKHTFSAQLLDGMIAYNCFHASCKLKGRIQHELRIDDIRNNSCGRNNNFSTVGIRDERYVIPDHFTSPLQNELSLKFLRRWNLLDKYADGLELFYDPKQQRVVFPLRDHQGNLKGATGRALNYNTQPRWYIYSRIDGCPYIAMQDM